jgi:hypothetical protein
VHNVAAPFLPATASSANYAELAKTNFLSQTGMFFDFSSSSVSGARRYHRYLLSIAGDALIDALIVLMPHQMWPS